MEEVVEPITLVVVLAQAQAVLVAEAALVVVALVVVELEEAGKLYYSTQFMLAVS